MREKDCHCVCVCVCLTVFWVCERATICLCVEECVTLIVVLRACVGLTLCARVCLCLWLFVRVFVVKSLRCIYVSASNFEPGSVSVSVGLLSVCVFGCVVCFYMGFLWVRRRLIASVCVCVCGFEYVCVCVCL